MAPQATMTASASYSRYMYGLGVFHARTKASLSATELVKKLAISPAQANAMMNEMIASNVVTTTRAGVVQAVSQHMKPSARPSLQALHDRFMDLTETPERDENFEQNAENAAEFNEDGLAEG